MSILEYSKQDRQIFEHLNDRRELVFADPMEVERKLNKAAREAGESLYGLLDAAYLDIPDEGPNASDNAKLAIALAWKTRDEAMDELIPILHAGFGTHPLNADGSGLLNSEALANMRSFSEFLHSLKKSTSLPPGSSPSGAGPQEPDPSPTSSSSGSSAIAATP